MRYWTTSEQRILEAHYPMGGADEVKRQLAEAGHDRDRSAIIVRASLFKIRFCGSMRGRANPARWCATDEIDRRIVAVYSGPFRRGAVKTLAEELGYPHWWVKRRAAELGVARPSTRGPDWSEDEIALVRRHSTLGLDVICRKLREAGFSRTRTAVGLILKRRLRVSPRPADRYSGTEVARMLGIDSKAVGYWIRQGLLEGEHRGTGRLAVQGGDMWWISHQDLREFILEHPHRIDLRKVTDAEWFVALCAGAAPDGRQHRRKKPQHRESTLSEATP